MGLDWLAGRGQYHRMRARAIRDLAQLSDSNLFATIAEGLELVKENAFRLERDARVLWDQKCAQGHLAVISHAKEEAAKVLILLDAVRCPRQPAAVFSRHLGAFNEHLAKGIYARCYRGRPASFREVEAYTKKLRKQFYLDGPEGVDWIFRNTILDEREHGLYVDYVETDERHLWWAPVDSPLIGSGWAYTDPAVLSVVRALDEVGCLTTSALEVIADLWRPVVMTPEFSWDSQLRMLNRRTLDSLDAKGLLRPSTPATYTKVIDGWLFPLNSLELHKEIPVSKDDLRRVQQEWLFREMGITDER
jgi:AbiV family abortive infection protein